MVDAYVLILLIKLNWPEGYSLNYLLVIEESGWVRFCGVAFFSPRRGAYKM